MENNWVTSDSQQGDSLAKETVEGQIIRSIINNNKYYY